jgi:DNA-binding transcriptional ArsR family regulator
VQIFPVPSDSSVAAIRECPSFGISENAVTRKITIHFFVFLRDSMSPWCDFGVLTFSLYFDNFRNTGEFRLPKESIQEITRYADMLSAMGTEPRLRIMRLLLAAHPQGMVVGDIGEELEIPNSTLSHHLEKLKNEGLVSVQREGTFLRYAADTAALQDLLGFLYAECCTRNKAVEPQKIVCCR